ncbi:MAG: NTF2 fold immunity protein [Breznakibacter sp.]
MTYINNKKSIFIVLLATFIIGFSQVKPPAANHSSKGYIPKSGFVPNDTTAIKIAEAVWLPIYGEKIYNKKPFHARLCNDKWIVEGSLPSGMKGGVPYIEIQKKMAKS